MKKSKKGPYIFITLLIVIVVFIIGVRYGKKVEEKNKTVTYLLSITPVPSSTPQINPTISYDQFTDKGCNTTFLYPSYLEKKEDSSSSAKLESAEGEQIQLTCETLATIKPTTTTEEKVASASVQINNKNLVASKKQIQKNNKTYNEIQFIITNPAKKQQVTVTITENLLPLFEQTFTFSQ